MKIKMDYVREWCDKRTGRTYRRFRRRGQQEVALPGLPGSAEFMTAYAAALASAPSQIGASRSKPGSLAALVADFLGSAEFKDKPPNTRRTLKSPLERFREQHGELPAKLIGCDWHLAR